jgi:hypothetical protein
MNNFLVKAWFGALVSLLAGLFPTWFSNKAEMSIKPQAAIVVQAPEVQKPVTALAKIQPRVLREAGPMLLCHFTGKAAYQGQPVAHAELAMWVMSPRGYEIRRFHTAADGAFDVWMTVKATMNEPVDWEIRGQTIDLKTVQLSGRHIVLQGESTFPIDNTLEFIAG